MFCTLLGVGVELACALQHRLAQERRQRGLSPAQVALISRGPILSALAPYARRAFLPLLQVSPGAIDLVRGFVLVSQWLCSWRQRLRPPPHTHARARTLHNHHPGARH